MNRIRLLLMLLLIGSICHAQTDRVVVRFVDAVRNVPLTAVVVRNGEGSILAHADSAGYAVVPFAALHGRYLVALCAGYRPDTFREAKTVVYMQPLTMQLPEATVTNNKISRVLQAGNEYVVDYQCAGNDIIVATYSGNNGGKAKVFLLNGDGAAVDTCKLPAEPVALYRSCVGRYYCVCAREFYPLQLWGSKVTLQPPYANTMLPGLQECQAAARGNHYYRLGDRQHFGVEYGVILRDDSVFKHIAGFEQPQVAITSYSELMEILALLDQRQFNRAAKKQMRRLMWDKASYAHMDMPLYVLHDTVVIFDYFSKQLRLYNLAGDSVGVVPIRFAWRDAQHFRVLQDEGTGRLYLHRYDNQAVQTVEELSISTGACGPKTVIGRPMAEDVKIHNGAVYFLWQDRAAQATRQLYVQQSEVHVATR